MLKVKATSLNSGCNASGVSTLLSVEKTALDGTTTVLNRCLFNTGDGTQRFCMENHMKLFNISCIIISSLAPHNISGFPGVFLALSDLVSKILGLSGVNLHFLHRYLRFLMKIYF